VVRDVSAQIIGCLTDCSSSTRRCARDASLRASLAWPLRGPRRGCASTLQQHGAVSESRGCSRCRGFWMGRVLVVNGRPSGLERSSHSAWEGVRLFQSAGPGSR